MKLYHGTSADNLMSILANGFDGFKGEQVWSCSSGYNYFWNPADLKRACGCETMEDARNEAKRQAKESADCCLNKAKDCRRVVFEVDLPRSEVTKDTSCQYMDGAVMACSPVPPSAITAIWIDEEPLDIFKGYFIACGLDRELRVDKDFTTAERTVGEVLAKSHDAMSRLFELLSEMELVEYPLDNRTVGCSV